MEMGGAPRGKSGGNGCSNLSRKFGATFHHRCVVGSQTASLNFPLSRPSVPSALPVHGPPPSLSHGIKLPLESARWAPTQIGTKGMATASP